MSSPAFHAGLSRSQGRSGWCVIFRHPLRRTADGRSYVRVRRGLGTSDDVEAQRLVDQMNDLLTRSDLHAPAARDQALRLYDSRIVNAFYHDLTLMDRNSWAVRDQSIRLPDRSDGYTRCIMLGTTGAGKTTLVRQLIGTDPETERFPSTASAKTTIADIEIVMDDGPEYQGIVTFISRDQTRMLIEESVSAAALASLQGRANAEVSRRLLEHSEQRFRLSYLLGNLESSTISSDGNEFDDWDADDVSTEPAEAALGIEDDERSALRSRLQTYLDSIKAIADDCYMRIEGVLGTDLQTATRDEAEALEDLVEDGLRQHGDFHLLIDDILDDVERRFDLIPVGSVTMGQGEWPSHWLFRTTDRREFISAVNRFSSNYAPNFGRLLTPLVDGIRVKGPFEPQWADGTKPKLVLLDGEGLGHTADTAFSISTRVTRKYDLVDAILLVDNAAQPMQAVPMAVLRSVVASGHEEKLSLCFTHFDDVRGDNLPSTESKKNHVLGSIENALTSLGDAVGRGAEISVRRMLEHNVVFLAGIDRTLTGDKTSKMMRFSRAECLRLLGLLRGMIKEAEPTEIHPEYDDANLVLAIQQAMKEFNQTWNSRLGLSIRPGYPAEHWTRVKALTRRLGELRVDEYDTLRPVAEMLARLTEHINRFLSIPVRWHPGTGSEETMRTAVNAIARQVNTRLYSFASGQLFERRTQEWLQAYLRRGKGSSYLRARDIEAIFRAAAPVPGEVAAPEATTFVSDVRALVREALAASGGRLSSD